MSPDLQAQLAEITARWENGHDELTDGCTLCQAEYAEAFNLIHAQPKET